MNEMDEIIDAEYDASVKIPEKYPLYPDLAEEAEKEAVAIMDGFKKRMHKLCEETLGELYCDVAIYIKSDAWSNFRNELMSGLTNYGNSKIQAEYDFKRIRETIYKEHYEEMVEDINKDNLKEIERLKKELAEEQGRFRDYVDRQIRRCNNRECGY